MQAASRRRLRWPDLVYWKKIKEQVEVEHTRVDGADAAAGPHDGESVVVRVQDGVVRIVRQRQRGVLHR